MNPVNTTDCAVPKRLSGSFVTTAAQSVYLAVVGDAADPRIYSGTAFHLLQEGRRQGVIQHGLRLSVRGPSWHLRRAIWNAQQVLRSGRIGGYQYSERFLEALWKDYRDVLRGNSVVNCFQLFPPSVVADGTIHKWFFIDQTLSQLFRDYGAYCGVSDGPSGDLLRREREGYLAAEGVIANSSWAAKSVIQEYGIAEKKVHVVVQGANIDSIPYERWHQSSAISRPCRSEALPGPHVPKLVFVGKDWRRKGLDRLIHAFQILLSKGIRATLRIIGVPPAHVPSAWLALPGTEWIGFIDKTLDGDRFLGLVSECDIGCLLSKAEAGGIALREYHALGLVVMGPDVGGAPDQMLVEASIRVAPGSSDEDIATMLAALLADPVRFQAMREAAWSRRKEALWTVPVATLGALIHECLREPL